MIKNIRYLKLRKNEIKGFLLGFCFAVFYIVIPSLTDLIPLYGQIIKGVIRPIFALIMFVNILLKQNFFSSKILRLMRYLIIMCVIMLITTIVGKQNVLSTMAYIISIITIPLFFLVIDSHSFYSAIKGISFYLYIVLFIYLCTVFVFHEGGLYKTTFTDARNYYFWGHVNSSIKMALPAIALFGIVDINKAGQISVSTWIISFMVFIAQIYSKSYVATIGMCIYITILLMLSIKPQICQRVPHYLPLIISMILFLCCCLISSPIVQHMMREIGVFFQRKVSIDDRIIMWQQGIAAVKKNIWGYGRLNNFSKFLRIGNYYPSTAHNLYIDLAMQIGIPGMVLFIRFLFSALQSTPDWNHWITIPSSLFVYTIMWNFEPYFSEPHFTLFLILLFIYVLLDNKTLKTPNGDH